MEVEGHTSEEGKTEVGEYVCEWIAVLLGLGSHWCRSLGLLPDWTGRQLGRSELGRVLEICLLGELLGRLYKVILWSGRD